MAAETAGVVTLTVTLTMRLASLDVARFDGTWRVTIVCPATREALGWTTRFSAQVNNGVLRGHAGVEGQPHSMTMTVRIHPDGNADVDVQGRTGDPRENIFNPPPGTQYVWHSSARFEGRQGSGKRTELRPCDLSFVKQ